MKNNSIHVYFMPGMAASPSIFEYIKLPEDAFTIHVLTWQLPEKEESLSDYAKRMTTYIKHKTPVLIGVSFGGILIQEMAKYIQVRKLIIISSIKNKYELPRKMIFARRTKAHKLLPTSWVKHMHLFSKYAFNQTMVRRLERYEKYIDVRDKNYLDWAIDHIVNWQQENTMSGIVHIHGTRDSVFPIKKIQECIRVKDGTHIMILHKYKWFNKNLPKIIQH